MATRLPYVRPPVVDPALLPSLRAVLGFRPFLRHAYAVRLDGAKLAPALHSALTAHDAVCTSLSLLWAEVERSVKQGAEGA